MVICTPRGLHQIKKLRTLNIVYFGERQSFE